jgi:hypothetical protein
VSIEEAHATGHEISRCRALALAACPTTLWVGNLAAAAHYTLPQCCLIVRDSTACNGGASLVLGFKRWSLLNVAISTEDCDCWDKA